MDLSELLAQIPVLVEYPLSRVASMSPFPPDELRGHVFEAMQKAFLKHPKLYSSMPPDELNAVAYGFCVNALRNLTRKTKRARARNGTTSADGMVDRNVEDDPGHRPTVRDEVAHFKAFLTREGPEREVVVFDSDCAGELTDRELAERLKTTVANVQTARYRYRSRLRDHIASCPTCQVGVDADR